MGTEAVILLMFVIASAVAVAARRYKVPYTVALVPVGLVLSSLHLLHPPLLTREMLFLIFLPALVFEAAFHIPFQDLWRDRVAVLALAIPGVMLAIGFTASLLMLAAGLAHYLPTLSWPLALLFGAAVAATDPISVVALFGEVGAPRRLTLLIEGESLFNDGTAIVFFSLILAVVTGGSASPGGLIVEFLWQVGGGLLIGGGVGLLSSQVVRYIDQPMVEVMLTTVAAYGAFLLADQSHASGVISAVTAGLICGNYGARTGMSPTTRIAVQTFWDYLGFALNSLVFLLMGFEIRLDTLLAALPVIVLAYLAMTLGRGLVVLAISGLLSFSRARIPRTWNWILTWGGLRGAISMVLALSLPQDLPLREVLVNMVFGVVLLSIVVQGLSMMPLARRLKVVGGREAMVDYETARMQRELAERALEELEELRHGPYVEQRALDRLGEEYRRRAVRAGADLDRVELDRDRVAREEAAELRRRLLLSERKRLMDAGRSGLIGDEALGRLMADVDARLLDCDSGAG